MNAKNVEGAKLSPADELKKQKAAEAAKQAEAEQAAEEGFAEKSSYEDVPTTRESESRRAKAMLAARKLQKLHAALPPTTSNGKVLFGMGGQTFTAGELRALVADMPPE